MSAESLDPFDRLHPALQHHIVNSLGWKSMRPTQLAAIAPILDGEHCILLAPTAGGKTEAALFPVLSRMLSEGWSGLSVLYVCPIKALLNNLEPRLSHYFSLVGRKVGVWHGDVAGTTKRRLQKEPPDLLLTTPESLEGLLISREEDRKNLLMGVRLIIVDELHAFCGDDRGWHVRCLIQRISRLIGRQIQVLGLSATVGNPKELMDWLVAGQASRVVGKGSADTAADIALDYVGSLENAAKVISLLHQGEKRLVFCDSRSKVEEVASSLRVLGVRTFVSHSSLSMDERRQAEKAFQDEPDCVIVATSTLELGIDVGDLDRVIQIDAPTTVASFLQRMGRTGRRTGSTRNCLFLASETNGFLIAASIVRLWREAYVEPVTPPPAPWHIVAQQAIALVLQHRGLTTPQLRQQLAELFPELASATLAEVLDYMLAQSVLWDDQGLVSMGQVGEEEYGRRNFEAILSTFNSPMLLTVLHGQRELGSVDPMSLQSDEGTTSKLILAGRYWRVVSSDWKSRLVWVEPSADKGKASWLGNSKFLGFALCQAMQKILLDGAIPAQLSQRAKAKLEELSESFSFLDDSASVALRDEKNEWRWWTFAGGAANFVLNDLALRQGLRVRSYDNLSLRLSDVPVPAKWALTEDILEPVSEKKLLALAKELKFSSCLPPALQLSVLKARLRNIENARAISDVPVARG